MTSKGVALITSDFILDPWLNEVGDRLRKRGFEVIQGPAQVPPVKTRFRPEEFDRYLGATDLLVTTTRSIIDGDMLKAAPRLRGVVFPTIGTESIDLATANQLGIAIANGPTPENFNSMAESTVMLMLALLYDLHGTEGVLRENRPRPTQVKARMLMNKTIGLVGFGRIARGVAHRLQAWNVLILVCDPYVQPDSLPAGVESVSLEDLLRRSDLVSMHATLTAESRHVINDKTLALMKPTAFFINTSRGGTVDEAALYRCLKARKIAGAALDAFELEPLPADHVLRELDNVILTPHMIGHTQEIFDAIPEATMTNIDRILAGHAPLYFLNPEVEPRWAERLSRLGSI